jgi:hypothetical protein
MRFTHLNPGLLFIFFNVFISIIEIKAQSSGSSIQELKLIHPTGASKDNCPIMTFYKDDHELNKKIQELLINSYLGQSIRLHHFLMNYLKNTKQITEIDDAYLALTPQSGGYARKGFWLIKGNDTLDKKQTRYVDVTERDLRNDAAHLMSITQLYPHEQAHIFLGLLLNINADKVNAKNLDMHYFSVYTNSFTAFNEGFAEHFENVSRLEEKDSLIRSGIEKDIKQLRIKRESFANGFIQDFMLPCRLSFYKGSMLFWYQSMEDLKRYDWAINGMAKYCNQQLLLSEADDAVFFRNTGINPDTKKIRNFAQVCSNEGAIDAFFTALFQSNLKKIYLPAGFYKPFVSDFSSEREPASIFKPEENLYLKIFYVLNNYVRPDSLLHSPFQQFLSSYIQAFPSEKSEFIDIFQKTLGLAWTDKQLLEIWVLVKNFQHKFWVMDPFGSFSFPCYTFNLNTAEFCDLMTVPGMVSKDANTILSWRDKRGAIDSLLEISQITNITQDSKNALLDCRFDDSYFNGLQENDKSFMAIIWIGFKNILIRMMVAIACLFILNYFLFNLTSPVGIGKGFIALLKILGLGLFYMILGIETIILTSRPWLSFAICAVLLLLLITLWYRNHPLRLKKALVNFLFLSLLVFYSLI